uniref:Enoyl-CoA hydratase/isomerase domain-containing protein n=1 Tax=Alexandrium andersonii TaxID=327968 RepID=A0A7S2GF07_9DINO
MSESVTLEECPNGLAIVTIDRPKALNAVNVKMVSELREVVSKCQAAESVKAVLFQGAGEKGFCSGGDVKALHPLLVADKATEVPKEQMWQEYNCIFEMRQLTKPSVSLIHGITMGCGLGLGTSSTYAVATEKSRLAMPENNIGLFPDAGFAYLAANVMPKGLGRLMALTGCHLIGAGDVLAAKLGSHFVPLEKLPGVAEALKALDFGGDAKEALKKCLDGLGEAAPAPKLLVEGCTLPEKFAEVSTVAGAIDMLKAEAEAGGWAAELLPSMQKGSPFSQAVVLRLMQLAEADATDGLKEPGRTGTALERDFAVACRVMYRPDFVEGLRAVLVDKDNAAKWQPAELAEVSEEEVAAALAPLAEGERRLGVAVA